MPSKRAKQDCILNSTPADTSKRSRLFAPTQISSAGELELGGGSVVRYYPRFFSSAECEFYFTQLLNEIDWAQKELTVMGRRVMQPRLTSYMADDPQLVYKYSGTTQIPDAWNRSAKIIKGKVEKLTGCTFNSCLLNFYRNGADCLGYHADNEPLYGTCPDIASVSLGTTRDFIIRKNADHSVKYQIALNSGDLLTMHGTTQELWMHAVPKRKGAIMGRINLTFRKVLT